MKILSLIQNSGLAEALASAVLHSLWQGLVIGLIVLLIVASVRSLSSRIRYAIAYSGLIITIAFFAVTFFVTYEPINEARYAENVSLFESATKSIEDNELLKKVPRLALMNPSAERIDEITSNQTLTIGIAFLWVVGVLFFVLKFFGEYLYINRLKRNFKKTKSLSALEETTKSLCNKLRIKLEVKVLQSATFKVPSVIGFFKPIIILPIGLINGLSSEQVEAVIMHELAHIKRKDYFMNIIQKFVEIVMFYHPIVWILSAFIRDEREKSCDDIVVGAMKNKKDYALALGFVQMHAHKRRTNFAMQFAGNKNKILSRMKRIVEKPYRKTKRFEGVLAAFLLVVGATGIILGTASFSRSNYESPMVDQDDTTIVKRSQKINLVYSDTIDSKKKEINVTLEDEEIDDLYIDGKKIRKKHYPKYEKIIAKQIDKITLEEQREAEVKTVTATENEMEVLLSDPIELEQIQERMTELSKQISERVKGIEIDNAINDDFVDKIEDFGLEVGKLGAEIGLRIAEAFQEIHWDSLNIEIDKEEMQELKEELRLAKEEMQEEMQEAKEQREMAVEQRRKAVEQQRVADEQKEEAIRQKVEAEKQAREAERQKNIAEQDAEQAQENKQLQKEIELLKEELEKVKEELKKQKEGPK